MEAETTPNVFYWNCADDRDHTHKRIEWAIENDMLVCINIKIQEKLLGKVKNGDIILAYEPKEHQVSVMHNGNDGKCMSCKHNRKDGRQAMTCAFQLTNAPIVIRDLATYNQMPLFRNWFSLDKHNTDLSSNTKYFTEYFNQNKAIYVFPIKYLGKLKYEITTNQKTSNTSNGVIHKYYGKVRKGFDSFNDIYLSRLVIKQFS